MEVPDTAAVHFFVFRVLCGCFCTDGALLCAKRKGKGSATWAMQQRVMPSCAHGIVDYFWEEHVRCDDLSVRVS